MTEQQLIEAASHVCSCRHCAPGLFKGMFETPEHEVVEASNPKARRIKRVTLTGEDVPTKLINALRVGPDGWVRLFNQGPFLDWVGHPRQNTHVCLRCVPLQPHGDDLFPVHEDIRYGNVKVYE